MDLEKLTKKKSSISDTGAKFSFKVILVGSIAVGKTSILNRYIEEKFQDKYITTIGVEFKFKRLQIDDKIVTLQIVSLLFSKLEFNKLLLKLKNSDY